MPRKRFTNEQIAFALRQAENGATVDEVCWKMGVPETAYIEPGNPGENSYCESFNEKLWDELLNGEVFYTLKEASVVIGQWQTHYNSIRPHSSLGYHPPAPEVVIWPKEPSGSAPSGRPAIVTRPTIH